MTEVSSISRLRVSDLKGPKRFYNESLEEFRKRREVENKFLKLYKRGKIVWQGKSVWAWKADGSIDCQIVEGQGPIYQGRSTQKKVTYAFKKGKQSAITKRKTKKGGKLYGKEHRNIEL